MIAPTAVGIPAALTAAASILTTLGIEGGRRREPTPLVVSAAAVAIRSLGRERQFQVVMVFVVFAAAVMTVAVAATASSLLPGGRGGGGLGTAAEVASSSSSAAASTPSSTGEPLWQPRYTRRGFPPDI